MPRGMSTARRLPRTLVVGGGIAGLTAAAALARRGAEVAVAERAPSFEPVGAGITIQANATAVLRSLDIELPAEDVVPIGSVEVVDEGGRPLTRGNPDEIRVDPPSLNVHRADLHEALLAACKGLPLEKDREVTGLDADPSGVEVRFRDGGSERFELVVGADGIDSAVRLDLTRGSRDELRYSGQTCWRFAVKAPDLVPELTVERWSPGRRAGIVPLSRGRIYVYLVETAPRGTPAPGSASPTVVRTRFAGIDPQLDAVLDRLDDGVAIHHDDLCDRPRVHFGAGRRVLIGDAAHPMTPNAGQGAGTAIEDAAALAMLLPRYADDVAGLVPALDALRRARVTAMQRLAWRIGQVAHWRSPLARRVRDSLLRCVPSAVALRQAEKLWRPGIELAAQVEASLSESPASAGSSSWLPPNGGTC